MREHGERERERVSECVCACERGNVKGGIYLRNGTEKILHLLSRNISAKLSQTYHP